ncbi:MAG: hypothetical protein D6725_02895, partial [Planctomycetota bacterium]
MQFEVVVPVRPGDRDRFPVPADDSGHPARSRTVMCTDGRLSRCWRDAFAASDADVVVFKHDDLQILQWRDFAERVAKHLGTGPIAGVAGAAVYSPSFGRWWRGLPHRPTSLRGRVRHLAATPGTTTGTAAAVGERSGSANSGPAECTELVFGPPGPAIVLDGCLIAVCRNERLLADAGWTVDELLACWDEAFGRHFYDVAFTYNASLRAALSGRPPACWVVDTPVLHHQPLADRHDEDPEYAASEASFIRRYGRRPGLNAEFIARAAGLSRIPATDFGSPAASATDARTRHRGQVPVPPPHGGPAAGSVVDRVHQLKQRGRIAEAVWLLRRAVSERPHEVGLRVLLAHTLMETGHITESLQLARSLLKDARTRAEGWNLIGFGLVEQARLREGLDAFHQAAALRPDNNRLLSNILFSSLYADHLSPREITELHRKLALRIEQNVLRACEIAAAGSRQPVNMRRSTPGGSSQPDDPVASIRVPGGGGNEPHAEDGAADTENAVASEQPVAVAVSCDRFRVGFLSADFRRHPVGYFLRRLLRYRDPRKLEVWCYHGADGGDDVTRALRQTADHWRDCGALSDSELARQIRSDALHVLVDLGGHTAANRAGVLVRRPAPKQVVYLGYPGTTGLSCVDAIIADPWVVPAEHGPLYTERVYRLPRCFLCYHPPENAPEVAPPPFRKRGCVSFGSFNHLSKLSDTTVRLWARILGEIPDARLVLKALALTDPGTRQLTARRFAEAGIDPQRIDLLPPTVPLERFLAEYARIDIALDTTPYGGGTTTCEALWMGVPVLTFPGDRFAGRMSASILSAAGLTELIAASADDYVRRACDLAHAPERLEEYRRTLRDRVARSALSDGPRFAAAFFDVLQTIASG